MITIKNTLKPVAFTALIAAPFFVTGCQTSCTGDARFDSYYCARSNISNGTYAQQTAELRQTAQNRQAQASSLRSQYNRTQARLRAARASGSSASTADVLKLEREVNSLQRALDQYTVR